MKPAKPGWAPFAAAALLAGVVLAVFILLQDYGPESTIRRFHTAAVAGDLDAMAQVTVEDPRAAGPTILRQRIVDAARFNARMELLQVDRKPREVDAEVQYVLPDGRRQAMVWIVQKQGRVWRVNADKTLTATRPRGI